MKSIINFLFVLLLTISCTKEVVNTNENNTTQIQNTISTWAHTFQPSILYCNVGDTIYFDLGGSHNAIEVSQSSYDANESTPIENGFQFNYGENGFFVPLEAKTYYYVCEPHLPEMKAKIIVE